jgi:hypothetical protein
MDSVFFLVILCGVAWLVFWSLRDHQRPTHSWSPFDMRDPPRIDPERPVGARLGGSARKTPRAYDRFGR